MFFIYIRLLKNAINLIKTIIDSTHDHLNTYKIFIELVPQKLQFTLFCSIFYEINIP